MSMNTLQSCGEEAPSSFLHSIKQLNPRYSCRLQMVNIHEAAYERVSSKNFQGSTSLPPRAPLPLSSSRPAEGYLKVKTKMRSSASRQNSSIRSKRPAIAACIRTSSQCEPLGRTPSLGPEHRTCTELLRSTPHNPVSTSFRRHRIRSPWRRFLCAPTQARTRGTSSTKMKALALKVLLESAWGVIYDHQWLLMLTGKHAQTRSGSKIPCKSRVLSQGE